MNLEQARNEINRIDGQMRELFFARMKAVEAVAICKKEQGLPILDAGREAEVIERNAGGVPASMRSYYTDFLRETMRVSRAYQRDLLQMSEGKASRITMELGEDSYDILIERGILSHAEEHLNLDRRVLVVTDDGVPSQYAACLANACKNAFVVTLPQGEASKCEQNLCLLWQTMLERGMTRSDCVVAVGGGVVGDLAGFAAATYMRGIDFYNIPTTLLSQVDSSIGGKTAIDFGGMKNMIGAFYQPKRVLIDPALLSTLDRRQYAAGLAEVIKMAATLDGELFSVLEGGEETYHIDSIIYRALLIKKQVVEKDQKEGGLRRVLNFGHTLGHGIEAEAEGRLLHGECVAVGMLPMCSPDVRERLKRLLQSVGLPTRIDGEIEAVLSAVTHDKKAADEGIWTVWVPSVGNYSIQKMPMGAYLKQMRDYMEKGEG